MQTQQVPVETNDGTAIERTSPEAPVERAETRAHLVRVTPAVDIFENEDCLVLVTDLPGVARDAIELRVDGETLSLSATQPERNRVFRRAFRISELIDPSGVDAQLENGVLTVRLPKREDMKPRRVEIRSGG